MLICGGFLVVVGSLSATFNFLNKLKDGQKPWTLQKTHRRCLDDDLERIGMAQRVCGQGYWWDYYHRHKIPLMERQGKNEAEFK